jgi:hypothetical protein
MQNHCTRETREQQTWAPHGQHGYSLCPALHHYRCQNVYISATASVRIVDTLEFLPHNFQMPQLSSTERLIMAANNMSNALKKHHPWVPFSHIGDETITALTTQAENLKKSSKKFKSPDFQLHLPRSLNANYPPNHPIRS